MALASLVDEGKLDWDTPVRHYLPWFQLHDAFATDRMTPRDLVTHRSGLPRYDLLWYNNFSDTREDLIRRLRYLEPSTDFLTVFQYQNLMYLTAGYLAGYLAGSDWETAVRQRVLDPLGMASANFSVSASKASDDFALPNAEKDSEVRQVDFRNIDLIGPAGSINANLEDMTKWLLLHLNGGKHNGRQIVSEAQIDEMHRTSMFMPAPYMPMDETSHGSYGLGWFIESYNGETIIHHGGAIDGSLGVVGFMPKYKLGVVVQTNLGGTSTPFIIMYNAFTVCEAGSRARLRPAFACCTTRRGQASPGARAHFERSDPGHPAVT
jgi:CubicO group peptidase (beta-lactamase class C family)